LDDVGDAVDGLVAANFRVLFGVEAVGNGVVVLMADQVVVGRVVFDGEFPVWHFVVSFLVRV